MIQLNKKKVLIFLPGGAGGAERISVLIGKILPKDRFCVKYVVVGKLRKIFSCLPNDYDVVTIPVHNIYCFSTLRIWWIIIKEKPDVVFVSQESYNGRVIIASKLAGRKVIVRSSNMIGRYKKLFFLQVKFTYPKASLLIAQQEEMHDEMIQLLKISPNKIVTIHNPIDAAYIDAQSSVPSPYPNSGIINFVNIARINHNKSQDIAVKAMAIVKNSLPQAHLWFVGGYDKNDAYYQSVVKIITELGLEDCIHFVGYDKNPFRWLKYADGFVFPSRVEGLPNALIEASYLGVPCAATRCLTIINEIIKDGKNGYVMDVNDVKGLAQAMIKIVELKKCQMLYQPGTADDFVRVFDSV